MLPLLDLWTSANLFFLKTTRSGEFLFIHHFLRHYRFLSHYRLLEISAWSFPLSDVESIKKLYAPTDGRSQFDACVCRFGELSWKYLARMA